MTLISIYYEAEKNSGKYNVTLITLTRNTLITLVDFSYDMTLLGSHFRTVRSRTNIVHDLSLRYELTSDAHVSGLENIKLALISDI